MTDEVELVEETPSSATLLPLPNYLLHLLLLLLLLGLQPLLIISPSLRALTPGSLYASSRSSHPCLFVCLFVVTGSVSLRFCLQAPSITLSHPPISGRPDLEKNNQLFNLEKRSKAFATLYLASFLFMSYFGYSMH